MIFYHATVVPNIKELNAFSKDHSTNKNTVVYLTTNREYALFYIRDMDINHVTCGVGDDGIVRYHEQFPNQLAILYDNMGGYIYKCNELKCIKKTSNNEVWVSNEAVKVDDVEYLPNVYDEILKYEELGKIEIIRYETLEPTKKQEINDMMVRYFYRNKDKTYSEKKEKFFRDNYTNAWNHVQIKLKEEKSQ